MKINAKDENVFRFSRALKVSSKSIPIPNSNPIIINFSLVALNRVEAS